MRKTDIKIGGVYLAKIPGRFVPVRVVRAFPYTWMGVMWEALEAATGRTVHVRSAARLRSCVAPKAAEGANLTAQDGMLVRREK